MGHPGEMEHLYVTSLVRAQLFRAGYWVQENAWVDNHQYPLVAGLRGHPPTVAVEIKRFSATGWRASRRPVVKRSGLEVHTVVHQGDTHAWCSPMMEAVLAGERLVINAPLPSVDF